MNEHSFMWVYFLIKLSVSKSLSPSDSTLKLSACNDYKSMFCPCYMSLDYIHSSISWEPVRNADLGSHARANKS